MADSKKAPCGYCGKKANQRCSRCKVVLYCNAECQKAHWPEHKTSCKPATAATVVATSTPAAADSNTTPTATPANTTPAEETKTENTQSSGSGLSDAMLRQLFGASFGAPPPPETLVPFKEVIDQLEENSVLHLQRYIELVRETPDMNAFVGQTSPTISPEVVCDAIEKSGQIDRFIQLLKNNDKITCVKFKIIEFLLAFLRCPHLSDTLREHLLRLNLIETFLELFFTANVDILRSELLQFTSELLADNKEVIDIFEQGQLISRMAAAIKESSSPHFLKLAEIIAAAQDEKIVNLISKSEEWSQVILPALEQWKAATTWPSDLVPSFQPTPYMSSFF